MEEGVYGRTDHVHVLGEGDVHAEAQDEGKVGPPEYAVKGIQDIEAGSVEQHPQHCADGRGGMGAGFGEGLLVDHRVVESLHQEGEYHQVGNRGHDDHRIRATGQVEAETSGLCQPSPDQCPGQSREYGQPESVQDEDVHLDARVGEDRLRDVRVDRVQEHEEDVAEGKAQEPPEYEYVAQPRLVPER